MRRVLPAWALVGSLWCSGVLAAPVTDVDPVVQPPTVDPLPLPEADTAPTTVLPEVPAPGEVPFIGLIRADDVNVRGGPSMNHFPLVRLKRDTEVEVIGRVFGWYRIKPPEGVFCWIHKNYVQVASDGTTGLVTGDNVNIRGDSILGHEAIRSDVVDQVGRGTAVAVVGEAGDFLRIKATEGTRCFVSEEMIVAKSGVGMAAEGVPARPALRPAETDTALADFKAAEQALFDERLKKPEEWDIDRLRGQYQAVLTRAATPRLKVAVEARLAYLEQLASLKVTLDEVARGRQETEAALAAIAERAAAQEAQRTARETAPQPAYTVTGILEKLELSDGRPRFKLVAADDPERILCIIDGAPMDLAPLVGRRVGINGTLKVSAQWPVKVIEVAAVQGLAPGDGTRLAKPPGGAD